MKSWVEHFPPLNLFNYNLFWKWNYEYLSNENLSDGGAMVSTGVDNRDGNTVGDDCKSSKSSKCKSKYI